MPSDVVTVAGPLNVAVPASRATVTELVLSATPLVLLRKLPKLSNTPMTGCRANATPLSAADDGWVRIVNAFAAPATSRSVPKFALAPTPAIVAVPVRVMLPRTSGVPAIGRTAIFVQVNVLFLVL